MARRPGRTTLPTLAAVFAFVAYGVARVAAPWSGLGLIFHHPLSFAVFAVAIALLGAALLFVRRVELAIARVIAGPSRLPTAAEAERLDRLLRDVAARAGIDPGRLIVRVQDDSGMNASAGASHLLFVTSGALDMPDRELEAILAHELGHHRGIHPVLVAVVWWLRLPGEALAAVYQVLRRLIGTLGRRLGRAGQVLAVPVLVLLVLWQVTVMWAYYLGHLLALRAARLSEYEADATAAAWGYAAPLAAAYGALARRELEPASRWARLTDEHPPLPSRIERLEGYDGDRVSA
jgi:Zn-dependent protease with chaperone function